MEGKFVVKTYAGFFNAVGPEMKLKQSIQQSKKVAGGVVGEAKKNVFVTEWELGYHEVLDISKSYSNITRSVAKREEQGIGKKEHEGVLWSSKQ